MQKKQVRLKDYSRKDINLLPKEYFNKKKLRYKALTISLTFILILSSASGYYYYLLNKIEKVNQEKIRVESRIKDLTRTRNEQDIFLALENRVDAKLKLLKSIEENNASLVIITSIVEKNLPKDITFLNMNSNSDGNITISGVSGSNASIAQFIHNLKETNFFGDVFVSNITKNNISGMNHYSFSLVCKYWRK